MNSKKEYLFEVNGLKIKALYSDKSINEIFIPLLKKWTKLCGEKNKRIIVFLAAPPAVGKTTLSLFLEYLSKEFDDIEDIQSLGLDGFHFSNNYLSENYININGKETLMKNVKGCPETFDINKFKSKLINLMNNDIKWPIYDRKIHDVIEDSIFVNKKIVLIEGNYLLLNEGQWKSLKQYCDYSIFIKADENMLKERLIERKVAGGLDLKAAIKFYEESDSINVKRVLDNSQQSDIELIFNDDYYV